MLLQSKYRFSLFLILIIGIFFYGFLPNGESENRFLYNSESVIEETEEEEEDKLEVGQHKVGHTIAKSKNVSFYEYHTLVIHKMSSVWRETCDIFFEIAINTKAITHFSPTLTSISPRYILFHRLVFYS